jgi:hypothetical protein
MFKKFGASPGIEKREPHWIVTRLESNIQCVGIHLQ